MEEKHGHPLFVFGPIIMGVQIPFLSGSSIQTLSCPIEHEMMDVRALPRKGGLFTRMKQEVG